MSLIDERQIVYINSRDRLTGADGDFTYAINLRPGNEFDHVVCLQAGIPKSYYPVQDGYNYLTLTELGHSITLFLTPGSYTRNSLAVAIGALLTAGSSTLGHGWSYTVAYPNANKNVDTGLYTITVTGNTGQPALTFDSVTFLDEMLGFAASSTNVFSGGALTSTQVVDLQPFSSIQIHSDIVYNEFATAQNTDTLQTVFANVGSAPFSFIQWVCPDIEGFSHNFASRGTSTARFYLTDEDGIPLDLNQDSVIDPPTETSVIRSVVLRRA